MERMDAAYDTHVSHRNDIENPLGEGMVSLGTCDRTLPQIRDNQKLYDIFINHHLATENRALAGQIIQKLADNPTTLWTPEENTFLERARLSFNQQMARVEMIKDAISDQEIRRMAARDPQLNELLNRTNNIGEMREVMLSQLDRLAVQNPDAFAGIVQNLRTVRTMQSSESTRNIQNSVTERLAQTGVTEEQYRAAIMQSINAASLTDDTRNALRQNIRERMGTVASIFNALSFGQVTRSRFKGLQRAALDEHTLFTQKQEHMRRIGAVLYTTLDPDMLTAVQQALRDGGRPEVRDERSVKTMQDYIRVREAARAESTPEARKARLKAHVIAEAERRGKAISAFTPAEKDEVINTFGDTESARGQEHRASGLLATLLRILFPSKADIISEARTNWP